MDPESIVQAVTEGPMLFAIPIALAAGLVSFFSPCVVPLIPGYLSYVTGLGVSELDSKNKGRMLAGSALFVLGFTVVFVSIGSAFGAIGVKFAAWERELSIVLGIVVILMGLAFMGLLPFMNREFRVHKIPAVGVGVAPFLGALFAIGWTPCIGPALAGVLAMTTTPGGDAMRGAILALFYSIGLGIPFILAAIAFGRFMRVSAWARRHQRAITLTGGSMLIAVGVLLLTGLWTDLVNEMRGWISGYETVI